MKPDIQLIQRCANFSELAYQTHLSGCLDLLRAMGFGVECFANADTDTQGFIAWNDEEVFVVFRGTESIRDWLTDADCKLDALGMHTGFVEAYDSVQGDLDRLLKPHLGKRVIFTGHSLGAALAKVAAYFTYVPRGAVQVITFGQPRVGNAGFRDHYNFLLGEQTIRVINDMDIVPRLPFLLWVLGKYRHAGHTEYFLDTCGCPRLNPPWWWKLLSDTASAYFDFRQRKLGLVSDHRMSDYLRALQNVRDTANIGTMGNSPEQASSDTPIPPFSQGNL